MITIEQMKTDIDGIRANLDKIEDRQSLESLAQLLQQIKQLQGFKKPLLADSAESVADELTEGQRQAMDDFFGMHKDLSIDSVEQELRLIRKGRRRLWDDI